MKRRILLLAAAGLAFALHMQGASADDMGTAISDLGHAWAKVYYQTPEKQQETQYPALKAKASSGITSTSRYAPHPQPGNQQLRLPYSKQPVVGWMQNIIC